MTRYEVLHNAVLAVAEKAHAILPPTDIHGIDQVEQHFGVTYTEKQLIELVDLPWPDKVLKERVGTHLLVADFPLSLNDLRALGGSLWKQVYAWHETPFARDEQVGMRWYLIRKHPVSRSLNLTYDELRRWAARKRRNTLERP